MWAITLKAVQEQRKQKTHRHGQQSGGYQREEGGAGEVAKVKGVKYTHKYGERK